MPAGPGTYDNLNTVTRAYVERKLVDQAFDDMPLFKRFWAKRRAYDGGDTIRHRLQYAKNTQGKWISGSEAWTYSTHEFLTLAEWSPTVWVQPLTLLQDDLDAARGSDTKLGDLMAECLENGRQSCRYYFTTGFWSDGTGTGSKQITGLQAIVDDDNTYGGIARSTYTWWAGKVTSAASASISVDLLQGLWGDIVDGDDKPDSMWTTQDLWDAMALLCESPVRSDHRDLSRNIGANELTFHGVPIKVDAQCPSGTFWMLNERYIELRPHADYMNFKFVPWTAPTNQRILVARLEWKGQLICTKSKRQGVLTNLVA